MTPPLHPIPGSARCDRRSFVTSGAAWLSVAALSTQRAFGRPLLTRATFTVEDGSPLLHKA